jgi:hypothetical protein
VSAAGETVDEGRIRTLLAMGATGVAVGIALAVLDASLVGSFVTVGSLVLLIYSLHRFGRAGADERTHHRRRRRGHRVDERPRHGSVGRPGSRRR